MSPSAEVEHVVAVIGRWGPGLPNLRSCRNGDGRRPPKNDGTGLAEAHPGTDGSQVVIVTEDPGELVGTVESTTNGLAVRSAACGLSRPTTPSQSIPALSSVVRAFADPVRHRDPSAFRRAADRSPGRGHWIYERES